MTTIRLLYDAGGTLVGQWCPETGRAQIGMTILAPERTCGFVLDEGEHEFKCDACGCFVTQHYPSREEYCVTQLTAECFVYCPFCGAKVVVE